MPSYRFDRHKSGFTLIELLIVVVIVSALASVVVPSFSEIGSQGKLSFVAHQASVVQEAIDRYYAEHGRYPHRDMWKDWCTEISDEFTQGTGYTFLLNRLKLYSNADGEVCDSRNGGEYAFGPYLNKNIPLNPVVGSSAVQVWPLKTTDPGYGKPYGWVYDCDTGRFTAAP